MFKSEVFQGIIQLAQLAFEEIVETFQYLEDWEDRYRHIIELGKEMPKLEIVSKTDNNKVNGCASQVWIDSSIEQSDNQFVYYFDGESDALIVSGLISILRCLYNGLSVSEVMSVNFENEMDRLGLREHLSSQRSNGLRSMVNRIRQTAKNSLMTPS